MSLADSLERAAVDLPEQADAIRPANGDPSLLLEQLEAADAVRVLGWLLEHAPEDADALCQAWAEVVEGAAVLAAVDEPALAKAGRKVLRRALHRARSRGLALPDAGRETEPKVARLPKVDEEISGAYVSGYDPRGARLVYVVESSPSGGARVFEALLDETRGLVDFQVYRAGRRQVNAFVRDITRRPRFPAVEAESAGVRALIGRRVAAQAAGRTLPRAFTEWRTRLLRDVDEAATPSARVREALAERADEAALAEVVALVEARELGPWPPAAEALEKAIAGLREQLSADAAAREVLDERAREAVAALLAGEEAALNAERFDETAYVLWRTGRETAAQACLATATALRQGDAGDHAVIRALVEVLARGLAEQLRSELDVPAPQDEAADAAASEDS